MKTSPTLTEIIQRAELQLTGIGLDDAVRAEATAELERDLENYAGQALYRVLSRRISPLAPAKKSRLARRTGTSPAPQTASL